MKKTVEFTGEELEMILAITCKIGGKDEGGIRKKLDVVCYSLADLNEKYPFLSETTDPEVFRCLKFIDQDSGLWIKD